MGIDMTNREEFELWWHRPEQRELRNSCAQGWGWKIWSASRNGLSNQTQKQLKGVKAIVYSYAEANPWHGRVGLSEFISKQTTLSSTQAYNAHKSLTLDGFLEKRGKSYNTEYKVKENAQIKKFNDVA